MDHHRFDAMTRQIATGPTRRSIIRSLLGGAAAFGLARDHALSAPGKTTICHGTGNGYTVITVANPALVAHYGHGDSPYTDCCADDACAGDATCIAGTCTAPEPCPPFEARINGVCQHPCPTERCLCGTEPSLCLASYAGEALCHGGDVHGFGLDCHTDQECQDDFRAADHLTYVCQSCRPDNPCKVCYGGYVACPDWTPV